MNLWVDAPHGESQLAMFGGHWPSASRDIKHLMSRNLTKPRDLGIK